MSWTPGKSERTLVQNVVLPTRRPPGQTTPRQPVFAAPPDLVKLGGCGQRANFSRSDRTNKGQTRRHRKRKKQGKHSTGTKEIEHKQQKPLAQTSANKKQAKHKTTTEERNHPVPSTHQALRSVLIKLSRLLALLTTERSGSEVSTLTHTMTRMNA